MNRSVNSIIKSSLPVLKRNNVKKAALFGSAVRGELKKNSDIDFLIEFKGRKSLLALAGLKIELEETLNKKVDVITYKSIHPLLKKYIMAEQVRII